MSLDINTPKGKVAAIHQRTALEVIESATGYGFSMTADDDSADIDAIFTKDGFAVAVAEVKSRDLTLSQLERFGNEWLVTFTKIIAGSQMASMLRVPFVGILYLIPEQKVMTIRIADENGETCVPFRVDRTITQKTINGGRVSRVNAYIDMKNARIYEVSHAA